MPQCKHEEHEPGHHGSIWYCVLEAPHAGPHEYDPSRQQCRHVCGRLACIARRGHGGRHHYGLVPPRRKEKRHVSR